MSSCVLLASLRPQRPTPPTNPVLLPSPRFAPPELDAAAAAPYSGGRCMNMGAWAYGWMGAWMYAGIGAWMHGCMGVWMHGAMHPCPTHRSGA